MVYCGAPSRGCQRCRQRKIKCDQRRPECLKCERSQKPCPGYRDLSDVMFRDESDGTIRKARRRREKSQSPSVEETYSLAVPASRISSKLEPVVEFSYSSQVKLWQPISQSIHEIGANFFFTHYIIKEPPFSVEYNDWLVRSYSADEPNMLLRLSIQAVGMAAVSNIYHAQEVASWSKKQYCKALTAMKRALNDPAQAIADTTLMAVILMGLFETMNFESWDLYRSWESHLKAATALLELRGQEQFNRERGGQLFIQIRSQILLACMQQCIPVPAALVQTTVNFENSGIRRSWRRRRCASPASICEISFRIVNLWAAFKTRTITDPTTIHKLASEIDSDLKLWRAGIPNDWEVITTNGDGEDTDIYFEGRRHIYPSLWIAEVWNNWRTLRIITNQIMLENEPCANAACFVKKGSMSCQKESVALVQQLSIEICGSTATFTGTPRILSFIRPLYIVCLEEHNPQHVRLFAVQQLRRIDAQTGVRQAGLLAKTVERQILRDVQGVGRPSSDDACSSELLMQKVEKNSLSGLMMPLVPCG